MNALVTKQNPDVRFWDKLAVKYSRQPISDPNAFERKIAITRSLLRPTDHILDIGCGTGSLSLRLAPFVAQAYGLDFSRAMVDIARDKARTLGVTNASFEVGIAGGGTPFQPASLDGVTAYSLLHLVTERRALLEQVHRLLKPGGFFVSSTFCLGHTRIPYKQLLPLLRLVGLAPTVAILSADNVQSEIRDAGFARVQLLDVGARPEVAFIVAKKAG
jgi:ubiquinone/menaquinone biosynthesis C-methylase UbiE